jgi:error-prone DNA polymerase
MTPIERLDADYRGAGMTTGPHPMHYLREPLDRMGVLRAAELENIPHGRRVRVAGAVITRQRPGTAKGVVFITLEDETGVANLILWPDFFQDNRVVVMSEPFLLAEGVVQKQDGVIHVKVEQLKPAGKLTLEMESHDFH